MSVTASTASTASTVCSIFNFKLVDQKNVLEYIHRSW